LIETTFAKVRMHDEESVHARIELGKNNDGMAAAL
jgi:hypothetical protein